MRTRTVLQWQAICSHTLILWLLLCCGSTLTSAERNGVHSVSSTTGYSALHVAAVQAKLDELHELLKAGADPDIVTRRGPQSVEGNTALILAAQLGHTDVVKALLDARAMVDVRSRSGNSALWLAANNGHAQVTRLLLDAGASVDMRGAGNGDGDQSDTPLTAAAYGGHPKVVAMLLEAGASINALSEPLGGTAVHMAIMYGSACHERIQERRRGHDTVLLNLLEARPNLSLRTHSGTTALLAAISMGCLHTVKALIAAGADVNQPHSSSDGSSHEVAAEGQTPLIAAARFPEPEIALALLDAGADVTRKDHSNNDALSYAEGSCPAHVSLHQCAALNAKKWVVAQVLRERTGDAPYIFCPVRFAVRLDDTAIVEDFIEEVVGVMYSLELEAGSEPDPRMNAPRQAADLIRKSARDAVAGDYLFLDCLREIAGRPFERAWRVAGRGSLESFSGDVDWPFIKWKPLQKDRDIWVDGPERAKDRYPSSFGSQRAYHSALPIQRAAAQGDYVEVSRLLHSGATANDKDLDDDLSVLHYAVSGGHEKIIDLLLRRGALVDMPTAEGLTPLGIASQKGSARIVTRLLHAGASVDPNGEDDISPLIGAATTGSTSVVHLLLNAGASIDFARSFDNATALQMACAQNHSEAALALIARGASPSLAVDSGGFPLLLAATWGMTAVVTALLQAGADPNQLNDDGKTALMAGVNTCYDLAIVKSLLDAGADTSLVTHERIGMMSAFQVAKAMSRSPKRNSCHVAAAELLKPNRALRTKSTKRESQLQPKTTKSESQSVGGLLGTLLLGVVGFLLVAYKEQAVAYLSGAALAERTEAADTPNRNRSRAGRGRGRNRGRGTEGAGIATAPASAAARTDQPQWWLELEDFHDELHEAAQLERAAFIDTAFKCEVMRNPTMVMSGPTGSREPLNTYEHDEIVKWFAQGRNTDPNTNEQVEPAQRELVRDPRLQREIRDWCEEKVRVWRDKLATQVNARPSVHDAQRVVHVFVDHSNATLGAVRAGKQVTAATLAQHVERGREAHERIVIGSHQSELARTEWEQLGYSVATDPRRGKERFVDEALHAQLMRTASRCFDPPHAIVLVTGDGNLNEGRTNFPECIEAALKNDWRVELHSWRHATSKTYHEMARQYKEHFSLFYLDEM